MVQDHVVAAPCGKRLVHGFLTTLAAPAGSSQPLSVPGDIDMGMTIGEHTLTPNNGLTVGYAHVGVAVVVLSIHDLSRLGVGDHEFHVWATDAAGDSVLDEEGILRVTADDECLPAPGAAIWFDAFDPSDLSTEGKEDDLPEPEVPSAVQNQRLATCAQCPFFQAEEGLCTECGCWMPWKTGLAHAECPIGKWGAHV